jgi:hypothetical protein
MRRQEMPRSILLKPLGEIVKDKPAGSAEIVFVPSDNDEAEETAWNLGMRLEGSGKWTISPKAPRPISEDPALILPFFKDVPPGSVSLFKRVGGTREFSVLTSPTDLVDGYPGPNTAANAVMFALTKSGFPPGFSVDPRLATGNVRIIVGPRQ